MSENGEQVIVVLSKILFGTRGNPGNKEFVFGRTVGIDEDVMVHKGNICSTPEMDSDEIFHQLQVNYKVRGTLRRKFTGKLGKGGRWIYSISKIDMIANQNGMIVYSVEIGN